VLDERPALARGNFPRGRGDPASVVVIYRKSMIEPVPLARQM
jgi:hypothetical protein